MIRIGFLMRDMLCSTIYDKARVKSILIIRMNRIGDMIYTLPVIRTLKKEFPFAKITVLAEPANAEVASTEAAVDEVLVYRKGRGLFHNRYSRIALLLGARRFDLAVSVKGGFSSFFALIAAISGARYRIGYRSSSGHILDKLYNLPADPIDFSRTHQLDACLHLLSPLGIGEHIRDISLRIPNTFLEKASAFFCKKGIEHRDNVIIMNISSNRAASAWSPERFVALGRALSEESGCFSIVCSSPDEAQQARDVSGRIGENSYYYQTESPLAFAAAASLCSVLVSGDGGASHLAAAVGTPVVALFGKTSPGIWRPHGEMNIVLQAEQGGVEAIPVKNVLAAILSAGLLIKKVKD
ncbi:MAG: glycosyl transferase family protein [Nitrospirae bacterium]|nr:MAG: glycosyl transferase family protein [Nitrospirota bacterium]